MRRKKMMAKGNGSFSTSKHSSTKSGEVYKTSTNYKPVVEGLVGTGQDVLYTKTKSKRKTKYR